MQIDWISGYIESPMAAEKGVQLYDTGQILSRDPDGVVKRIGTGKALFEGSHDSRILVSSSMGYNLYLSGNPVKHIQGHNLFGSDDAVGLFLDAGRRVRESTGLFPSPASWGSLEFVGPRFTRLDLTRSFRFASNDDAREWIRTVASAARSRHGSALLKGETVYFGQDSERWAFKVYSKFDELKSTKKGHGLSHQLSDAACAELLQWAEGVVRFELTVRSKEIEKWPGKLDPSAMWEDYFSRIKFNRNEDEEMISEKLKAAKLGWRLRLALLEWRSGVDLRSRYSKATFYRIRRQLLDECQVDVASPPLRVEAAEKELPAAPVAVLGDRAGLNPDGWDPEPIEAYFHRPDPEVKKRYA